MSPDMGVPAAADWVKAAEKMPPEVIVFAAELSVARVPVVSVVRPVTVKRFVVSILRKASTGLVVKTIKKSEKP